MIRTPNGVDQRKREIVAFTVRQWLDMISSSNAPWLNPEVIEATRTTHRRCNLASGMRNLLRDQAATETPNPQFPGTYPLQNQHLTSRSRIAEPKSGVDIILVA